MQYVLIKALAFVLLCLVIPAYGQQPDRPLVLAHYMPWYIAKPTSGHWGWHWTMNHFDPEKQDGGKREIASQYYPLIGPYDSADKAVLEYHLLLMKLAGIDGVIVDWYGRTDLRDYAQLHHRTFLLLQQCERLNMKLAICYEDQTIPALVDAGRISKADRVSHAVSEIDWLGQYWFNSPSYVRLEGKPLLLSFGHAGLSSQEWGQCLAQLKSPVTYFSQDIRREGAVGAFAWPSPKRGLEQLDRFLKEAENWPDHIAVAFPRFHDIYRQAKVSDGYPRLPDDDGATFRLTLEKSLQSNPPIIQLATWNDWGEGTQIEPSREFGYRDLEYLQHLRRTSSDSSFEFRPEDLRLPRQLLKLRRAGHVAAAELDAAALAISQGRQKEARRLIERDGASDESANLRRR